MNLAARMRIYLAVAVAIAGCTQHSTRDEPKSGAEPADTVHRAEDALNIAVHRRDVPLEEMPIIPQTLLGLPMSGRGNVAIDLNVPAVHGQSHYRRAAGTIA